MPFSFEPVGLPGLISITPRVFTDERGFFFESYKESDFDRAGISTHFVQDNQSSSVRGVLRGLHYQLPPFAQGKLVQVLEGRIWDVAVDIRSGSSTLGKWFGLELSSEDHGMFYIPPGFAHGFVTLTDRAQVFYRCTGEYNKESEAGIRWNDPGLGIRWPSTDVKVSERDRGLPFLSMASLFPEDGAK